MMTANHIYGIQQPFRARNNIEPVADMGFHDLELICIKFSRFEKNIVAHSDFANIMALLEMDFDQLYRMYVGKNVLNFFRQDHGYKDGSYIKVWNDREDNEHLAELLGELDSSRDSFRDDVYQGLARRYPD